MNLKRRGEKGDRIWNKASIENGERKPIELEDVKEVIEWKLRLRMKKGKASIQGSFDSDWGKASIDQIFEWEG